jgi:hypothetical protein
LRQTFLPKNDVFVKSLQVRCCGEQNGSIEGSGEGRYCVIPKGVKLHVKVECLDTADVRNEVADSVVLASAALDISGFGTGDERYHDLTVNFANSFVVSGGFVHRLTFSLSGIVEWRYLSFEAIRTSNNSLNPSTLPVLDVVNLVVSQVNNADAWLIQRVGYLTGRWHDNVYWTGTTSDVILFSMFGEDVKNGGLSCVADFSNVLLGAKGVKKALGGGDHFSYSSNPAFAPVETVTVEYLSFFAAKLLDQTKGAVNVSLVEQGELGGSVTDKSVFSVKVDIGQLPTSFFEYVPDGEVQKICETSKIVVKLPSPIVLKANFGYRLVFSYTFRTEQLRLDLGESYVNSSNSLSGYVWFNFTATLPCGDLYYDSNGGGSGGGGSLGDVVDALGDDTPVDIPIVGGTVSKGFLRKLGLALLIILLLTGGYMYLKHGKK